MFLIFLLQNIFTTATLRVLAPSKIKVESVTLTPAPPTLQEITKNTPVKHIFHQDGVSIPLELYYNLKNGHYDCLYILHHHHFLSKLSILIATLCLLQGGPNKVATKSYYLSHPRCLLVNVSAVNVP